MTVVTTTINVNQSVFNLKFDERIGEPYVEFEGENYADLTKLVNAASFLSDQSNLKSFILIANFLFRGNEFEVIEDIADFQKRYSVIAKRLPHYGIYDISVVKPPVVKDGLAIFFAEHSTMHVPYRVTCTYPYIGKAHYNYGLLKEVPPAWDF